MAEQPFRNGGIDITASTVRIAGDVVGRDQIVQNISHIINHIAERPLTTAEETDRAQSIAAQQLRQGVTAYVERLRDRVTASTDTGGPYKGLLEYRLSDAAIFFGRTPAVRDLLDHVQRSPLTILHAESGAGKTSLLQAGISPYLIAAGHLPIYLRPYNVEPALAVKKALVPNLADWPQLRDSPLHDFFTQVVSMLGHTTTPYIFLDQFEEFFVQLDEIARARFIADLANCLDDESLNVRWVLAVRSEFFGNLANFRPRIRNPFENDYRLNRLTRAEALEAITAPTAPRGITFEDGLINAILDELGQDAVAPPQVQLVCTALYESLPDNTNVITRQLYDQQRGAKGILQEHLGRVLHRDLPADQRPIAQQALEALITSDVHRVLRTRAELATDLTLRDARVDTLDRVLSQLVDSRLLRAEEIDGQLSYELAHDYLLSEIQLDPAVQARKAAQELLEQEVHAYQRYGTLLNDDKFAILAPRRNELALNNAAQTLFQKSERALKRRQRLVFGGIGLVIALMIIGAISIISAIGAQTTAQNARQQQAAAELNATQAAQSAVVANQSAATAQVLQAAAESGAAIASTREAVANESLRRAFQQTGIAQVGRLPGALAFDGKWIWVANQGDSTLQSIDVTTGQVSPPIKVDNYPSDLVFDGTRMWVANAYSNTVQSIDPATGQVNPPIKVDNGPFNLAFDGTRVWVASAYSRTVQSIDPTTDQVGPPIKVDSGPSAFVFDGTRLWVANALSDTVQSIDPTTDQVGPPLEVGNAPSDLVFDGTRVWVANSLSNTVQSIDPTAGQVGPPIEVGNSPARLAFDGTRVWVANDVDASVQSIDPATDLVGTPIKVGNYPSALAFDGTRIWIANSFDANVQAIDPTAHLASPPIPVGSAASALAFDGVRVWVANAFDNAIQSIDSVTGQPGPSIVVYYNPTVLAFDGTRVWVATNYARDAAPGLTAIDPATGQVSPPIIGRDFNYNGNPAAMAFDGTRLWVARRFGVLAIDPDTGQVSPLVTKGFGWSALVFDGTRVWATNRNDNTVQSIDPTTGQVGLPIKVGGAPGALAFDGTRVWIANYVSNTVQAINPVTAQVDQPIPVGKNPSALAFDNVRVWVANDGDHTVQSIDPATGHVSLPIKVLGGPHALVFGDKRLWIANSSGSVQYIVVQK